MGARPLDNEHLQEKDHSHKQQNLINVVEPPCKQESKFGQADLLSAIVDTDLFLSHLVLSFKAGCVKDHIDNWRSVTTDPVILDAIKHHHIEFEGGSRSVQATKPRQITFSSGEK